MQYAKAYAESLKRVAGIKPEQVQVYHDPESSSLFYGRYAARYSDAGARSFAPDPEPDLQLIRSLSFPVGGELARPFALAQLDVVPTPSTTDSAWNLNNASGYWSLQVGVFYNTREMTERRSAAEQYCKLLREQGEEAYFHHGRDRSSVCIGTFPQGAIAQMTQEDPMTGRMTVKARIVDKKMLELQKRFPHNLENGFIVNSITRDAAGKITERTPNASFPVLLPQAERNQAP